LWGFFEGVWEVKIFEILFRVFVVKNAGTTKIVGKDDWLSKCGTQYRMTEEAIGFSKKFANSINNGSHFSANFQRSVVPVGSVESVVAVGSICGMTGNVYLDYPIGLKHNNCVVCMSNNVLFVSKGDSCRKGLTPDPSLDSQCNLIVRRSALKEKSVERFTCSQPSFVFVFVAWK